MPPAGPRDTAAIVEAMIAALNSGKAEKAINFMHPQRGRFITPLGREFVGSREILPAWREYFKVVRDYRIEHGTIMTDGEEAFLCGTASGVVYRGGIAVEGGHWRAHAAWRAISEGPVLTLWQVFADNQPLRRLLGPGAEISWITGDARGAAPAIESKAVAGIGADLA